MKGTQLFEGQVWASPVGRGVTENVTTMRSDSTVTMGGCGCPVSPLLHARRVTNATNVAESGVGGAASLIRQAAGTAVGPAD